MNKFDRQIEQAKRIIDNLPQRNVMKEEDIANWLATKLKEDPERLIWHARRLGCFGGSDIGVLVAEMRNNNATSVDQQYHTFKSARDIISEKLCIILPGAQDEEIDEADTKRGSIGENFLANLLVDQFKSNGWEVSVDNDTMDAMKGSLRDPDHPWLEGNIDLALLINNNIRILTDIKWPRSGNAQKTQSNCPFSHVAQLHQYKLCGKRLATPIDYDKMVLASFDSDTFQFYPAEVEYDEQLEKDILAAGDHYFQNYLLKGKIPPYPKSRIPVAKADDFKPEIRERIDRGLALKAIENTVQKMIEENTDALNDLLKSEKTVKQKFNAVSTLGSLTSKIKYNYDFEALSLLADKYGLQEFIQDPLDKNSAAALHSALLKTEGVTEYEINTATKPEQSFITTLSRKQSGSIAEMVGAAKKVAEDAVENAVPFIQDPIETVDKGLLKKLVNNQHKHADTKMVVQDGIHVVPENDMDDSIDYEDDDDMMFRL